MTSSSLSAEALAEITRPMREAAERAWDAFARTREQVGDLIVRMQIQDVEDRATAALGFVPCSDFHGAVAFDFVELHPDLLPCPTCGAAV